MTIMLRCIRIGVICNTRYVVKKVKSYTRARLNNRVCCHCVTSTLRFFKIISLGKIWIMVKVLISRLKSPNKYMYKYGPQPLVKLWTYWSVHPHIGLKMVFMAYSHLILQLRFQKIIFRKLLFKELIRS